MPLVDREGKVAYLTVREVASRWRISDALVRETHIKGQGLRVESVASRMLVPVDDLLAYERKRINEIKGLIKKYQRMLKLLLIVQERAAEGDFDC